MSVYRSSKSGNSQRNKYFYYDNEQDCLEPVDKGMKRCSCGNECADECSCDCHHSHSHNHSQEANYDHNDDPSNATVVQDADQYSFMEQESAEMIWVKESCNIRVNTTDTQVGISLQAALQLAIALVIRITIGDSDRGEEVSQELVQHFNLDQTNRQKIYICNTKDATVTTTDTDLAINIQILLQILVAIIIMIDIL
ncbi:spore coat protein [Oceanobacillus massiliensis]|uniref:spore coat protein n=1 Tax=Oceanobacillus massiliensis TaxID=1465765 RepID=UPI0030183A6B